MKIQKLAKANGFLAIDLPDAPLAVGPTRLAPKILQEGAEMLARSITYTFASFGLQHSGASAGINSGPDDRDEALTAYMEEVAPLVADGKWLTWPGSGVTEDDLAPLRARDARNLDNPALVAAGAVAASEVVTDSGPAAFVGTGPAVDATRALLTERGRMVANGGLDAACDTLFVAGKAGVIDHDGAADIKAKAVVPLSPVPITSKAYAVLRRNDVTYIPDFVAVAAPLLAALDGDGGDAVARVRQLVEALAPEGPGMWLAACGVAEAFLHTWQDALPFGRPLA